MRWCFQNAAHPYADAILQQLANGDAVVPVLWLYEVSAVLAKSQKDGILPAAAADAFLATLATLKITVEGDSPNRILKDVHRLAVTYRLTSYEAAHLELAIRRGFPIATLDNELIAASKLAGVALL
jgi:predicted nucleic acid-binding protein